MNRRGFFKALGAVVGGIAVEQAIPLGRVWSFPTEIACLNAGPALPLEQAVALQLESIRDLIPELIDRDRQFARQFYVGQKFPIYGANGQVEARFVRVKGICVPLKRLELETVNA